ncbi:hypothetical protein BDN72DRAFT_849011 [Pluteus cervinus]|uniref:Uncharacterized protein n=1 Tax=Pluteus cervinus TaxID=181527 RepID=A0ACD3A9X4_9AGAR|nr:hypothetical protein BDN72DRAFT_849011 [Pluteus cervinus]
MTMTSVHLPPEIHELIISHFKPINDLHTALSSPWIDPEAVFHRYQKSVYSCTQFRFVNRAWNHLFLPFVYNLLVIPCRPSLACRLRVKAVDHHSELVHTIILRSGSSGQPYHEVSFDDTNLLRETLNKCTRLVRLETWIGKTHFIMGGESYIPHLFGGINSLHLRSAVFYSVDLDVILNAFSMMESRIRNGLTELVLGDMFVLHQLMEPELPLLLPSLERLTLKGLYGGDPGKIADFICQITRKRPSIEGLGHAEMGTTPLRHLLISGIYTFLDDRLFTRILTSSHLGFSLTSLEICIPATGSRLDAFTNTPTAVTACCPNLTRLMYLTLCPIPFIYKIPTPIEEFGVLIAHKIQVMMLLPSTALTTVEPLMEVVDPASTAYKRNLKKLWVVWENGSSRDTAESEEVLRERCGNAGVELFNELPTSLS